MQTIRTIHCKISVSSNDIPVLNELFDRYAHAISEIACWGRDNQESNAVRLHHALYYKIREKYNLPANLTITAIRRASGTLKTAWLKGKFLFRSTFVALDERTFRLFLQKEKITFSTHLGRKTAKLEIGDYQRIALSFGQAKTATLVRTKKGFFANIVVKTEVQEAHPGGVLGIDLGIRNIAATSSGRKFDGKEIRKYREFRWRIRASLQSKGTRGTKRVLRRLSGLERRRASWTNHNISKAIVKEAVQTGCSVIAFENLKGIRTRLKVPCRCLNRMISLWSFFQLRNYVRYKAAMKGISVVEVNPAYSSQTCGQCSKRGIRNKETFVCTACGLTADADINAAKVIAARGAAISRPELTVVRKHG